MYRVGSLKTVASEMAKSNLEFKWNKDDSQPADGFTYFYVNGNVNHHVQTGYFVNKETTSVVKSVEFVTDKMSFIILRGHWCGIIVPNVQAPNKDKSDDKEDRIHE